MFFFLVRILGGILQIAAQWVRPINTNLYIAAAILEAAGLSPLLLATLGFVQTVCISHDACMRYLIITFRWQKSVWGQ
jgi:hypothetical protein